MGRRWKLGGALVALVLIGTACEPANPPAITAERRNPVTFGPSPDPAMVMTASEGDQRVVAWADSEGDLRYDRFDGSTLPAHPQPFVLAEYDETPPNSLSWSAEDVALGGGYALFAVERFVSGPHGFQDSSTQLALRNPDDVEVPLSGDDLSHCETWGGTSVDLAWNGTRFLASASCAGTADGARLLTISTAGVVTERCSSRTRGTCRCRGSVRASSPPTRTGAAQTGTSWPFA